ncbi:MAG TPA: type IX secretion system membrane protein PorP/SprF [Chryseolinea sp.]|nr:type IX secretion system membrane protein PorP/SprF [Chryseolinea sp.]
MRLSILQFLHKITIPILFGLSICNCNAQQAPQFTQFMYNNLVINPAYAGAEEALSLTVLNRNQWTGVEKAPSTQSFAIHSPIRNKNIGLGLTILRDQIGVHSNTSALSNYAYHIRLKKDNIISAGLQVGVTNLKSDYASLLGSSNDPKLMSSINEILIDFGAGIYFRSSRFQLGLSAPELLARTVQLNDTISVDIKRTNFLCYAQYRFTLGQSFDLEPGIMIKYFPDLPLSVDVNCNLVYRKVLTGGLSYRRNESVDILFKFQITAQFQFGYAYDYPIQHASQLAGASHELLVQYVFRSIKKHVVSPR